ncbi:MAG: hypothetical protein ACOC31_04515 [Bacteroidota bacterium]
MTAQTQNKVKASNSNWILKPEKEFFTHDELIDAYLRGKEDQKNENQKVLLEKLEKNIKYAQQIVEKIADEITNSGFKTHKSYLRINNIIKYDAVFDISLDDFTSDEFDKIYQFSRNLKNKVNTETFNINFTFMPHTNNLNEKRIVCEGFIFTYEKRG